MRACGDEPDQCRIADTAVMEKGRKLAADIHRATLATLSTVNALASGLSRIPGPKTLVLLSDGFVVQNIETTLRSVVGQSARAGARVYAIDVRGLNRGGPGNNLQQLQATDEAGAGARFDSGEDGPNSLAVDTGGMMIRNENNIGRALDRIADDSGRYYVLAYQPVNTNFDGKYRPLEVRVKRPGVRVRARRGYLALDPSRMLVPQPIKTPSTDSGAPGDSPAPPTTAPETTTASAPAPAPLPGDCRRAATPRRARPNAVEDVDTLMRDPSGAASVRLAPPAVTALSREGWAHYAKGCRERPTLLAQAATEGAPPGSSMRSGSRSSRCKLPARRGCLEYGKTERSGVQRGVFRSGRCAHPDAGVRRRGCRSASPPSAGPGIPKSSTPSAWFSLAEKP